MPRLIFLPQQTEIEVEENTKILIGARRARVPIRFGCAACSCGTCAVKIALEDSGALSSMKDNEKSLLQRMKLSCDGDVRLSCQARILAGTCKVDLDFQDTYSPDQGDE